MDLPKPVPMTHAALIANIEQGRLKIPQFQRDFVWSKEMSAKLMDSIVKGYPIGTFIFWKTKERLRSIRDIGGIQLPEPPKGDFVEFILDGQQRLTSIFATLKGLEIERESGKKEKFSEMYVDLLAKEDEEIVTLEAEGRNPDDIIKLTKLIFGTITELAAYPTKHQSRIDKYRDQVKSYIFSTVLVENTPIDIATEIFTRVNVGGKPLSVFEIMVAKTFDMDKKFDLAEEYDALISTLEDVNYDTVSDATVLQTVSTILKKDCRKKVILKLTKAKFIKTWPDVVEAIKETVDYFRNFYRIPVSQLLPYNALIVPFAYFFYHHKKKPTGVKQKYLQDFFWRVSLSERYSHSLETRLAQDIKKIDKILKGRVPRYDYHAEFTPDAIYENGYFSTGRSYIKAILCLYAYQEPKSFIDNSIVQIRNNWLKRANSRNYHHFFPKAYLRKRGVDDFCINHILNITIVDDYLNKVEIRAKPPAQYMRAFDKKNPTLQKTMRTHLINKLDTFGVWDNDYDEFLDKRAKSISKELNKRLIL